MPLIPTEHKIAHKQNDIVKDKFFYLLLLELLIQNNIVCLSDYANNYLN